MRKYTELKIKEKIGYSLSLLCICAGIFFCINLASGVHPEFIPLSKLFSHLPDDGIILATAIITTSVILGIGPFLLAWLFFKMGKYYEKRALRYSRR